MKKAKKAYRKPQAMTKYVKPGMKKETFDPKVRKEGKLSEIIGSGFVYAFSCSSCGGLA